MQWIVAHWWWIILWLIPGFISTYFMLDCQEWPIKIHTKDDYAKQPKYIPEMFVTCGQNVIVIHPFFLLCSLLFVVFWPITVLLLWLMWWMSD